MGAETFFCGLSDTVVVVCEASTMSERRRSVIFVPLGPHCFHSPSPDSSFSSRVVQWVGGIHSPGVYGK